MPLAHEQLLQSEHQIWVELSSNNSPRFDRNTNTDHVIADDEGFKPLLKGLSLFTRSG